MKDNRLLKILLVAFIIRFTLAFWTWHPDVFNHMDWGLRFFDYGPKKFYTANVWSFTWPNQPPGTIYMFAAIRKLFELVFNFFWWINVNVPPFPSGIITYFEDHLYPAMLKLPAIIADLGIAYLMYRILKFKKLKKYALPAAVVFLVNPVVWYNSAVWGQSDSVINFFLLLSAYFLLKHRLSFAVVAFAASIYIKASLLIFLPLFLIFAIRQRYPLIDWLKSIGIAILIFGILTYPFADKNVLVWLFALYKDKVFVNQLQVITANAFNLWAGLTGIHERPHSTLVGPFTYQTWGVLLFLTAYLPALYLVIKRQNFKTLIWSMAISSMSAFMLLTNMHERYLYPLFIPLTMLLAIDRKLVKQYTLISAISLLNLYNFWWVPRSEPLINLLSAYDRLLPRLLGFVNFGLFMFFYFRFFRQNKISKL